MRRRVLLIGGSAALIGAASLWPLAGLSRGEARARTGDRPTVAARRQAQTLRRRLEPLGAALGAPVFLRIFKEESLLEVFVESGGRYQLLAGYPICRWSGTLGPKLRQGDGQSPEGFYRVRRGQLNPASAFHLSFDLGYPNAYDRAHGRTGSALMVHGSCVSIGCYAMTDDGIEQIYTVVDAALAAGQQAVQVHACPFRLTAENAQARIATSPWRELWSSLREGTLAFERDGRPPAVEVRDRRYVVSA